MKPKTYARRVAPSTELGPGTSGPQAGGHGRGPRPGATAGGHGGSAAHWEGRCPIVSIMTSPQSHWVNTLRNHRSPTMPGIITL